MLELVAVLNLEVNEKEQAPLGHRIRAVGMCFYKKGDLKDVRAHCYCASIVRTLFIGHARATSFSSARTDSKTQQNIKRMTFALTWCANIFVGCSVRSLPFLSLFIILKNKRNLCVERFNYFSFTIKKRVELVHGYRCARLKSCIF